MNSTSSLPNGFVTFSLFVTDIDECATGTHRCSQKCNNAVGGYRCSCSEGFEIHSDNITCSGVNQGRVFQSPIRLTQE